jgi:hypothetical protein
MEDKTFPVVEIGLLIRRKPKLDLDFYWQADSFKIKIGAALIRDTVGNLSFVAGQPIQPDILSILIILINVI